MKISVHLFAAAKEAVGSSPVELQLNDGDTVSDLKHALVTTYTSLSSLQNSLLVAVNNQYADHSVVLKSTDEVACFPPVSGG